tara:strand:- start:1001 stop:1303 length:303 start_codon:yes stop_codon:yes gene_type:complete
MNTKELANWDELGTSGDTSSIEVHMLAETKRIFDKTPKVGIPTRHFKDDFNRIFGRKSTNPQPRLNKAMRTLANSNLVELKKVAGRNYIRYVVPEERATK